MRLYITFVDNMHSAFHFTQYYFMHALSGKSKVINLLNHFRTAAKKSWNNFMLLIQLFHALQMLIFTSLIDVMLTLRTH